MAHGFLVPQLGVDPMPLAVKVWILNHWTSREFPPLHNFKSVYNGYLYFFPKILNLLYIHKCLLEISTQMPNEQFKSGMPQSVMLCSTFRFSYDNASKSVFQIVQMKVFGEVFNLLFKSNPMPSLS